jgi:hypothetical protein
MTTAAQLISTFLLSFWPFFNLLIAQSEKQDLGNVKKQDLGNVILSKDSLFWAAYSDCNVENMEKFFTGDVEFYHDKNGLVQGRQNLINGLRNNLCGNENFKLRREAIEGSAKVFPLQNSNVIYGAIISGEHVFYIQEKGKEERLDGLAKYTHVWILKDNAWKMSRILSFDHGPAPYINHRKAIKLSDNILNQFAGQYLSPKAGQSKIVMQNGSLQLIIGNQRYLLYPQSENSFFVKERDNKMFMQCGGSV